MATRTFLTSDDFARAVDVLIPPITPPTGQVELDAGVHVAMDFSSWLALSVEHRLRELPSWEESAPIAIGSWGRGELCPGSDLDVIFCGSEKAVEKVVREIESQGLKLRYRVPQNLEDWTQGVEVLEVNALFWAKPLSLEGSEKLQVQLDKIKAKKGQFRRNLLKAMAQDRRERSKRYSSIANFLEPNLKFGAGGYRDLYQALILKEWFSERFEGEDYSTKLLQYYRSFFLLLRQKLHLSHSHDILTAPDQHDLAQWLGYANNREFMAQVQKGLSRVSFHSDWVTERCQLSRSELVGIQDQKVNSLSDSVRLLQKDSRLQSQALVRRSLYETQGFASDRTKKIAKGKLLRKILDVKQEDQVVEAAFRSQLISHLIPNYTKVIGLVQHDQYHRYTVDAHLLQAVREVGRLYKFPKLFGRLQFYAEKLKESDWEILRWTALYHDMAKGSEGDHAIVGQQLVREDLKSFGFPKPFIEEVRWLVENHLLFSKAAFRKNPHSPQTWQELFDKGVRGERLYRLALFTFIDILATNPDAWNSWKENLTVELIESLRNPGRESHYDFSQKVLKKKLAVPQSFIDSLDPSLIENVSHSSLLKDFSDILAGKELKPLVLRDKKNRVWVRFHRRQDQSGLLLSFTQSLNHVGCNIRQAYIYTDDVMGVLDWFCVKTTKPLPSLRKQLLHNVSVGKAPVCSFAKIDLSSVEESEWVFSFRAKDKKGLLLSAIQALHEQGLEIIWAQVHTWGRQIDDIFGVRPKQDLDPEQILKNLKLALEVSDLEIL